jgi:hypothetical protein
LCERFGVKTTTARTGKFCLVAAALFGDPDVDLQVLFDIPGSREAARHYFIGHSTPSSPPKFGG